LQQGHLSILGGAGKFVIVFGALLATSSAISGTLFGASRLMAVIARRWIFAQVLFQLRRNGQIPVNAIITMSILAFTLILTGGLQTILEFGSITFIIVSVLMALANFKIRQNTKTKGIVALVAIAGLSFGAFCLFYYEYHHGD
jgi:amino acid transporter